MKVAKAKVEEHKYRFDEYKFRLMAKRGRLVTINGTNYLPAYDHKNRLIQCTPAVGFGFRSLY